MGLTKLWWRIRDNASGTTPDMVSLYSCWQTLPPKNVSRLAARSESTSYEPTCGVSVHGHALHGYGCYNSVLVKMTQFHPDEQYFALHCLRLTSPPLFSRPKFYCTHLGTLLSYKEKIIIHLYYNCSTLLYNSKNLVREWPGFKVLDQLLTTIPIFSHLEHGVRLLGAEINLGVGVQAKGYGCVGTHGGVNMLQVLVVRHGRGGLATGGIKKEQTTVERSTQYWSPYQVLWFTVQT